MAQSFAFLAIFKKQNLCAPLRLKLFWGLFVLALICHPSDSELAKQSTKQLPLNLWLNIF